MQALEHGHWQRAVQTRPRRAVTAVARAEQRLVAPQHAPRATQEELVARVVVRVRVIQLLLNDTNIQGCIMFTSLCEEKKTAYAYDKILLLCSFYAHTEKCY